MTPLPDSENTLAPGERFIDAALREHARNGSASDDELVHRILAETVNLSPRRNLDRTYRIDRRTLYTGAVAVAAVITGAILILSHLPFGSDRDTDEFFIVARPVADNLVEESFVPGLQKPPRVPAQRFEGQINPITQSVRVDTIELSAGNALPYIEPFSPSLDSFPEKADRERLFRVSADRIERNGDSIYYSGNVVVEHSDFRIEAEQVAVDSGSPGGPRITATLARVEQPAADRFVSAENLSFDPVVPEMQLTAISLFSAGGRVHELETDDTLILTASAYTVENAGASNYASPVK